MRIAHSLKHLLLIAFVALVLGPGFARPQSATDDAKPLSSILVVAREDVSDPSFAGAVVLVMNNLAPSPVGLIVNHPSSVPVGRLFPDLKRLAQVRDTMYFGGPVDVDTVWFLIRTRTAPRHAVRACDGVYLSADRDLLLELLSRRKPMDGLRIFLGHAGWAPGQLEFEIERGDWASQRADQESVFSDPAQHPRSAPPQDPKHTL